MNTLFKFKTIAFVFLASISLSDVFGQQFGVRVSQNTDFMRVTTSDYNSGNTTYSNSWKTNFSRFTISLLLNGKNNLDHELELFIPEINTQATNLQFPYPYEFQRSASYANRGTSYALRYILSKKLTPDDRPLSFKIGLGANPYYVSYKQVGDGFDYPKTTTVFGASLNFVPAVNYSFGDHLHVSLDVPVKLYDYKHEKTHIANPSIPIRQQDMYKNKNDFFDPVFTVRLGVAYLF